MNLNKYIFLRIVFLFCLVGINVSSSAQIVVQGVSITGSYNPQTIAVGGTSQLEVIFSNDDFTQSYGPGEVFVQIQIPTAWYSVNMVPTGTLLTYFTTFSEISPGLWYGENDVTIPPLDIFSFLDARLYFTVDGDAVVGPNNATLFDTGFIDQFEDSDPSGNNTNAGLIVTTPLPVTYKSFTAKSENCDFSHLDWTVVNEVNNKGFEVERKVGKEYEVVGTVEGKGTSAHATNYSFTDKLEGKYNGQNVYYRLKQVDFDGRFNYSKELSVRPSCDVEIALNLSPNPTKDLLYVALTGVSEESAKVRLFDQSGKFLKEYMVVPNTNFEINVQSLNPGVYTMRYTSDSTDKIQRFIKVE